jgi:hypothetical protein
MTVRVDLNQNQPILTLVNGGSGGDILDNLRQMWEEKPWLVAILGILIILLIFGVFRLIKEWSEDKASGGSIPIASGSGIVMQSTPGAVQPPVIVTPQINSGGHIQIPPGNMLSSKSVIPLDPSTQTKIPDLKPSNPRKPQGPPVTEQVKIDRKKEVEENGGGTVQVITRGGTLTEMGGKNEVYRLEFPEMVVGSSNECNVKLEYSWISKKHAVIKYDSTVSEYIIYNESKTNPILVNDEQVPHAQLNDGDKITMGKTNFEFKVPPRN